MNFSIKTKVRNNTKESVMSGFTNDLFLELAPPFPRVKLLRFDGSATGNEIHLQMNFIAYTTNWVSLVTVDGQTDNELFFVDEGITLPSPLKFWRHRHGIVQDGNQVIIVDNITYRTNNIVLDLLLFPSFYFLFYYRKPIYKRYFDKSGL